MFTRFHCYVLDAGGVIGAVDSPFRGDSAFSGEWERPRDTSSTPFNGCHNIGYQFNPRAPLTLRTIYILSSSGCFSVRCCLSPDLRLHVVLQ